MNPGISYEEAVAMGIVEPKRAPTEEELHERALRRARLIELCGKVEHLERQVQERRLFNALGAMTGRFLNRI